MEATHHASDYSLLWPAKSDDGREVAAGVYLTRVETVAGLSTGRIGLAR